MQKKKQVLIVVLSLLLLLGGLYVVLVRIAAQNKGYYYTSPEQLDGQTGQSLNQADRPTTGKFSGKVILITGENMEIFQEGDKLTVGIKGNTPVSIFDGKKSSIGQMADVKIGDMVNVAYSQTDNEALQISIVREK